MSQELPRPDELSSVGDGTALAVSERRGRGADVVVETLLRDGLRTFFGVPGGAISPINDALLDLPNARVVLLRHETEAMFAACGHYRATNAPAVVFVTSGPGVTNAVTGLASTYCDGVPVVLLVGEVPRPLQGKNALQDGSSHHLGVAGMVKSIAKACWEAASAHALLPLVRRAVRTAISGRPGPVVLVLPLDVLCADASTSAMELGDVVPDVIPHQAIEATARLLEAAARPVLLAGAGVRAGDGPAALLALAEDAQIPVVTTPKGKGVFPEDHSLALGVFGIGGHPSATAYLRDGADVLLALGTSLGDLATEGWSDLLVPSRAFIHVDVDGAAIGKNYPTDLGIVARAAPFLRELAARSRGPRARRSPLGVTTFGDPSIAGDGAEGRISPARAIWELQRAVPEDAIFVVDSGEHFLFAVHFLRLARPDAFVAQTGLGAMGSSIGAAIGLQLAKPGRPVVVIMGDGGFGMVGTQIADAAALGLPIVVCVFNDRRLTMCEVGHVDVYGRTPAYDTPEIDVAMAARAMGAEALDVEHTGDIARFTQAIAARRGPLVINAKIDRSVKLPKKDRVGEMGRRANAPSAELPRSKSRP